MQNEHVRIAVEAIKEGKLDKLIVMPDYIPPHKQDKRDIVSAQDRINMLSVAFKGIDKVCISSYEVDKQGTSYTYLTMEHFRSIYPDDELYFMVGSDMLADFPTWKNPERILNCCNLLYCERADEDAGGKIYNSFIKRFGNKVLKLPIRGEDISSSKVRLYIALGLDVKEFIPTDVNDYITANGLYKDDRICKYLRVVLPEKRRIHTAGVALTALKICKQLGIDGNKVRQAALLHDCAKYKKTEDYPECVLPKNTPNSCVHQYLGAYVAEKELGITDSEILDAIRYHTTGRADMSLIGKIVYVADVIEPSRSFAGVDKLREEVFKDFDSGFNLVLKEMYKFLNKDSLVVDSHTAEAVKYYCKGEDL